MNMHRTGRLLCLLLAALLLTCPGCAKKRTVISDAAYFSEYLTGYDLNRPIRFEIVFADGHAEALTNKNIEKKYFIPEL